MKHNWTYKKLGEVVTIERGGSPRPIQDYITTAENGLNWIKIGDAVEGSKYITSTKEKIKPEGLKKTRFVHKGDFILSNSMSFGRPYILAIDGCIHDGWLVLHDENQVFDKSYLYYYLSSPSIYEEFKRLAVGGVVNNLNSNIVRKVKVAIPSLSEQESIVAELDGINRLIDLQEEQLCEYDRLAQSLFYTTFGDPTTNPKGWSLTEFSTLCDNLTKGPFGSDIKKSLFVPKSKDTYKVYIQVNAIQKDISLGDYYISKEYFEEKMRRFELHSGDYIITCDGTLGKFVRMTPNMERGIISASLLKLTLNERITSSYFESIWNNYLLDKLVHQTRNAALVHLPSATNIGKELIPLPPLTLQQTFAVQIEAIEHQKALIRRSLDETRTLLAARMQYYFNS